MTDGNIPACFDHIRNVVEPSRAAAMLLVFHCYIASDL